nr:hypothetical protein [Prevotella pallens]
MAFGVQLYIGFKGVTILDEDFSNNRILRIYFAKCANYEREQK